MLRVDRLFFFKSPATEKKSEIDSTRRDIRILGSSIAMVIIFFSDIRLLLIFSNLKVLDFSLSRFWVLVREGYASGF